MISISQVISVISVLIAGYALYRNLKGDAKQDTGALTTVIVKLETIGDDVREMRNDIKDVKKDMDSLKDRVTLTEASLKSAHKRIDDVLERLQHAKNEKEN